MADDADPDLALNRSLRRELVQDVLKAECVDGAAIIEEISSKLPHIDFLAGVEEWALLELTEVVETALARK